MVNFLNTLKHKGYKDESLTNFYYEYAIKSPDLEFAFNWALADPQYGPCSICEQQLHVM
jgi:hypothetical protein